MDSRTGSRSDGGTTQHASGGEGDVVTRRGADTSTNTTGIPGKMGTGRGCDDRRTGTCYSLRGDQRGSQRVPVAGNTRKWIGNQGARSYQRRRPHYATER